MDRSPLLHGRFYESDPAALARVVDAFLADTTEPVRLPPALRDTVCPAGAAARPRNTPDALPLARAVMLPHAGHVYCGRVLGQTLARCRLPEHLVLLCPDHTGVGAPLAVWPSGNWITPLGAVPVNEALCADLLAQPGYVADPTAHEREHSLEVLLPFLQRHAPRSTIAPVRVSCGPEQLQEGAAGLARVLLQWAAQGQPVGLVISSDMNHYAPEQENMRNDVAALTPLLASDAVTLFNTVHSRGISMCGVAPATMALLALQALEPYYTSHFKPYFASGQPTLIAYTTSAEATGDVSGVVGYAGVLWG